MLIDEFGYFEKLNSYFNNVLEDTVYLNYQKKNVNNYFLLFHTHKKIISKNILFVVSQTLTLIMIEIL